MTPRRERRLLPPGSSSPSPRTPARTLRRWWRRPRRPPMPDDQKPMDWEEADIWWDELCVSLPLMDRGLPDVHSQDAIFRVIALARQERERAERAELINILDRHNYHALVAERDALKARADRLPAAGG